MGGFDAASVRADAHRPFSRVVAFRVHRRPRRCATLARCRTTPRCRRRAGATIDPAGRSGVDLGTLRAVEQRVLSLATRIIDHANRRGDTDVKAGDHQASSASMVSVMTALWFARRGSAAARPGPGRWLPVARRSRRRSARGDHRDDRRDGHPRVQARVATTAIPAASAEKIIVVMPMNRTATGWTGLSPRRSGACSCS